ncbi:hypothetical protein L7F22_069240 [Adiantum nelumboides]|nr:hypothetical protein [Adiantum nelumboides]
MWVLELQEYEYTFIVEDSTRASLADVLTYKVKEKKITPKAQGKLDLSPQCELEDAYTLLFDGAYCRQRNKVAGGFVILNEEKKEVLKKGIQLHFAHSNNEAEYAALKVGLEECKSMGIKRLMVKGDALLIVRHVQGTWACKNSKLLQWLHEIKLLFKFNTSHANTTKRLKIWQTLSLKRWWEQSSSKNLFFKDKRPWRISCTFWRQEQPSVVDHGPDKILDRREKRLRNRTLQEYLVAWKGLLLTDATWESDALIRRHFPSLIIEDNDL